MNLGNRNSQHNFATVPDANIQRSKFDRSFSVKDTLKFDELTPIIVDEVLPGDSINLSVNHFTRLATQVVPVMDNMYMDFHFFFVPNRLVWDHWEQFNGAQNSPGDSTDFLVPSLSQSNDGFAVGTIYDHMGIPTQVAKIKDINSLPLRAYNLIYNEWFRDQNLQIPVTVPKGDGPDSPLTYAIKKRGKRHDYFTSALPWPQKGPAIDLSLGGMAPVVTNNALITVRGPVDSSSVNRGLYGIERPSEPGYNMLNISGSLFGSTGQNLRFGDTTGLQADLTGATSVTINELREAFMMQSLFELDARGGTRYVEILRAHFNVTSPDFRLQRPEYLGGGSSRITTHPVAQTSGTEGDSPQANLAAFGTASSSGSSIGFTKSFVEHGYIIGLCSARADVTYQQGINRLWTRRTRYDFFWPKLQQLGEQAVLNKEIYVQGENLTPGIDDQVFGYQERYAEYRYKPSEIRGQFRSSYAQSLDMWHMAQEFGVA